MGLRCTLYPEEIPQHVWDYSHPDYDFNCHCKHFEFEPVETKYNWFRALFVGMVYVFCFVLCLYDEEAYTTALSFVLGAFLWYEIEVFDLRKERDMYIDRWRHCKLSLKRKKVRK